MEENNNKNYNWKKIVIIGVVIVIIAISGILLRKVLTHDETNINNNQQQNNNENNSENNNQNEVTMESNYTIDIIKNVHSNAGNSNYLLSPFNLEIALNMLREGADGKTKEELDKVLGNRKINNIVSNDKIGIANGIFIKNKYKNSIKDSYVNLLKTKYNSEIVYDELEKPDVVNNWVSKNTNGMIDKILDDLKAETVLVLASALSIDVKWLDEFDCYATRSEEFTKIDNSKINVEMMHKTLENSNFKYIKTDDVEGIVLPYDSDNLEFIGLLPNNGIDNYINNLTKEKLDELFNNQKAANSNYHISLSLPRFTYDYDVEKIIPILKTMGINEVFDTHNANLSKMVDINKVDVYVDDVKHKTHIELSETGTKAAAATAVVVVGKGASLEEFETVNIEFNKPFIYMIRDNNSKEILFFGTVYEPNIWNGKTCKAN